MNKAIASLCAIIALAIPANSFAGNPSGGTPGDYAKYCKSIRGIYVKPLQTCNGIPLSVYNGVNNG